MTTTKTTCYCCGNDVSLDTGSPRYVDGLGDVLVCHSCIDRRAFAPDVQLNPDFSESILEEAERLTANDRSGDYGPYGDESKAVAIGWNVLIVRNGSAVSAALVPLMMIWLKLVRQAHRHKRDNLVDIAGYAHLASKLANGKETP